MSHLPRVVVCCVLLGWCALVTAQSLYVRIDDLTPQGVGRYVGADIDAIELYDHSTQRAWYAHSIVASELAPSTEQDGISIDDITGLSVLVDFDAPYAVSLNGGWVIARLTTGEQSLSDDFRLTIFEVDGSLFDWGDGPDPYRVSVARSEQGPWHTLGMASGTARFTLAGQALNKPLTAEMMAEIEQALINPPANDPVSAALQKKMQPTLNRLQQINDIQQLEIELAALWHFYDVRDHVVNEHKEADGGRVMAPWLLLDAAYKRFHILKEKHAVNG